MLDMFRHVSVPQATGELSAASVEALLRLVVQLHGKTTNPATAAEWPGIVAHLGELPAAKQLPAATVVELVQHAMQSRGAHKLWAACDPLFSLLFEEELTDEQVEGLMSLLRVHAAIADVYNSFETPEGSVMKWLASQPGAAAAAVDLGLTAADVRDPAAAALLFGGQQAAGTAGGVQHHHAVL